MSADVKKLKRIHDVAQNHRFDNIMLRELDSIYARLVRRNVVLQDNDGAYLLSKDSDKLRLEGSLSLNRLRKIASLLKQ